MADEILPLFHDLLISLLYNGVIRKRYLKDNVKQELYIHMKLDQPIHNQSTLVFVTDQIACDRLIRVGRKVADLSGTELFVINIVSANIESLNRSALEHLYSVSMEHNAAMNILNAERPFSTMADCIRQYHAEHVVTGAPKDNSAPMTRLWKAFPEIYFYTVSQNNQIQNIHSAPGVAARG